MLNNKPMENKDFLDHIEKAAVISYQMGVDEGLRQAWAMISECIKKYGSIERQGRRDGMIEACNIIMERMPVDED